MASNVIQSESLIRIEEKVEDTEDRIIDTSSLFDLPILISLLEYNNKRYKTDELRKLYVLEDFNKAQKANCLFQKVGRVGFTQRPTRSFII
jgi:hypothetical protein